jgi:Peptidase family M1 domain
VHVRTPPRLTALVSGVPAGRGHWKAQAVRDVAVAVARFRVSTATAYAPGAVRVRVGVPPGAAAGGFARLAARALERLSRKYGPYPWTAYTLAVAPDLLAGGIEYPTLSFIGSSNRIQGVIDHETAHQWFYSLVGNDQARDPGLDETLATWAQQRIDGLTRPDPGNLPEGVQRHVGAAASYWIRFPAGYFWGLYEEGANALRSLRDDASVDCALRAYAARRAYAIARPGDLLDEVDRVIPGAERRLRSWGIHR